MPKALFTIPWVGLLGYIQKEQLGTALPHHLTATLKACVRSATEMSPEAQTLKAYGATLGSGAWWEERRLQRVRISKYQEDLSPSSMS